MIIGHVTSTAVSGGDAPVFEKAGLDAIFEVGVKQDSVQEQLAAQAKQISDLTGLLTQLVQAQIPAPAPVAESAAPEAELTPQEKANITKAKNKAAAEAAKAEAE